MDATSHICPWCSISIRAGAATCPKCGAVVEGAIAPEIPDLPVLDPKAALGPDEGKIPDDVDRPSQFHAGRDDLVTNMEAILPPSEAVRREMRKMQLEAFEAGLLDTTGPAGETDFVERARALEEEKR
jgi:hypothetical protein